jgi:hypothetical protein
MLKRRFPKLPWQLSLLRLPLWRQLQPWQRPWPSWPLWRRLRLRWLWLQPLRRRPLHLQLWQH